MYDTPLLFIDTETTGLDVSTDRVIEFGAIAMHQGSVQAKYLALLNPTIPIHEGATAAHKISNEHVVSWPTWAERGAEIMNLIDAYQKHGVVVTYNGLGYDIPLLNNESTRHGNEVVITPSLHLDVYVHARWRYPSAKVGLGDIAKYYGIVIPNMHTALADCWVTSRILKHGIEDQWIPDNVVVALTVQSYMVQALTLEWQHYGHLMYVDRNDPLVLRFRAPKFRDEVVRAGSSDHRKYLEFFARQDDERQADVLAGKTLQYGPMSPLMRGNLNTILAQRANWATQPNEQVSGMVHSAIGAIDMASVALSEAGLPLLNRELGLDPTSVPTERSSMFASGDSSVG